MKKFEITEPQLSEIAWRLDMIAKGGLPARRCARIGGIHAEPARNTRFWLWQPDGMDRDYGI